MQSALSSSSSLSETFTVRGSDSEANNERTVYSGVTAIPNNQQSGELQGEGGIHIDVLPEQEPKSTIFNESSRKRALEHPLFAVVLLVAAGTAVSFQSGMNAAMRAVGGRSFSSVLNFATGTAGCFFLFVLDLLILKTPHPRLSLAKETPWYSWMGGILGTYYIIVNIFLVPVDGAGTVLSVSVCSQVIVACLMDHFSITGIPKRQYSIWRILASLGLIGCVAVITLF